MDSITITLHDGELPTKRVTVGVMDPIQILHDQIPAGGRRLIIFRGSLIMAGFTFRHHGIKDGDDLYVVRPRARSTTHSDAANQRSTLQRRPALEAWLYGSVHGAASLLREAGRLSDLTTRGLPIRAAAIEDAGNETAVRISRLWKMILEEDGRSQGPRTDPLPICWK
jgi:hypothetical protein